MNRLLSYSLILFFFISGCSATNGGGEDTEAVGLPAPNFTHTSLEGEEFTLNDFRGKVVYLFFYGAGCPHCRSNGPVTENIHQQFLGNQNFIALGLDTWNQSVSSNQSFRNSTGISYPLLLNAQQTLVAYYNSAGAYDRSVVIDAEGNIAYKGTGFVNTDSDRVQEVIQEKLNEIN